MKKILMLCLLASFFAQASTNENNLQLEHAQQFYEKISYIMGQTDKAAVEYHSGDPSQWKAINSDLNTLASYSEKEFGPAFSSPFQGCFKLGNAARDYWQEKVIESSSLDAAKKRYEDSKHECKQNIISPKNKKSDLAILDLTK